MQKEMTTDLSVIEGNRLIAIFDGCTTSFDTYYHPEKKIHFEIEESEYHNSWDWIMKAIKKWDWMTDFIGNKEYEQLCEELDNAVTATYDIEEVYPVFVKCIKWYNEQNK